MQFFKKTVNVIKNVEFFGENNIFQKLNNSTFGIFHNNIKKMDIPTDDFKLPIITIIGNESSGKSSLISNILKCDIFPINKNRCTKCPIKIELVNNESNELYSILFKGQLYEVKKKEEILKKVTELMKDIEDIIEDELHILFQNPNVITSTYYDLPGIIEYPDNLRQKSKEIVNKYIQRENTLIICVIPASTPRLTSNQALGLIIDAKKTKDCIIALSMVDLLHDDDIEVFINRIIMKSDEINKLDIHNVIGLSNNSNIDEKKWFSENILAYITDAKIKKKIIAKITLENLIKSVDIMYDNYIKLNWKEKALETASNKILKLNEQYNELGSEELNISEVYNYIKTSINFNEIFNSSFISELLSYSKGCIHISEYNNDNIDYDVDEPINYDKVIELIMKAYNNSKIVIKEKIIAKLFNIYKNPNNIKLERFQILYDYLNITYIKIIDNEFNHIDIWFNSYIQKYKYEMVNVHNTILTFNNIMSVNFRRYIFKNLNEIEINDKLLLNESEVWKEKRLKLKEEIAKYMNSKIAIENL